MIHVLKTVQPFFGAVTSGTKSFEVRKNDRGFSEGDLLFLCEYDMNSGMSGHVIEVRVTSVFSDVEIAGLEEGFVAMGIIYIADGYLETFQGLHCADVFTLKNSSGFYGMVLP